MPVGSNEPTIEHALIKAALAARGNPRFAGLEQWLDCEIGGYGVHADTRPLHTVLGVAADHPLVERVAGYRVQIGMVTRGGDWISHAHLFVEPISELERIARAARGVAGLIAVDFGPHAAEADYPRSVDFPPATFERILSGFRSTLAWAGAR